MKLLFIQGGTRFKKDNQDNWYTDGNFDERIWNRYKSYCTELTVITRCEDKRYDKEYAERKFNKVPNDIQLILLKDLYKPKKNFFDFNLKRRMKKIMQSEIEKSDFVIIRSITNFYTLMATKICRKLNKRYLIEVTGVAFDALWNHGDILGKIYAIPIELKKQKYLKDSPYAVYVTERALQERYPCKGETLGCSDVEIQEINDKIIDDRNKRISENKKDNNKIVIGTLAWVNLKTKGQKDVIKAISLLKKRGKTNFEYQLVGGGSNDYLKGIAEKYDVIDQIKFLGQKPHDEVFGWLDNIDVYIQPSYQEGLCRAVVEAMSRGCMVVCSDVGGNSELASSNYIFKKKDIKQIAKILENINDQIAKESKRSFEVAKKYEKNYLNKKRDEFYNNAIND